MSIFISNESFQLENGSTLPQLYLEYTKLGEMSSQKDNVIWFIHPFSAVSDPQKWLPFLVGPGLLFSPEKHCIISVNIPGSPYGSSSPIEPHSPQCTAFPEFTVHDTVNAFELLRKELQIPHIQILCGASLGGMIAYEWLVSQPQLCSYAIILSALPKATPWIQALNFVQKKALQLDPTWGKDTPDAGKDGLALARMIAFLSYRNSKILNYLQDDNFKDIEKNKYSAERGFEHVLHETPHARRIETYLDYQGEKFTERFNAYSYWNLMRMMDEHDIGKQYGSIEAALTRIKTSTLVVGVDSDLLFPCAEIRHYASMLPFGIYQELSSLYGHDAFLIEDLQIKNIISDFLYKINPQILYSRKI